MEHSEQIAELAAALASAQGAMDHASKDRTNPAFKSKYADLASVIDACRPALSSQGIAVVQPARVIDSRVEVDTLLVHKSGQWMRETLAASVKDTSAQTIGSAITYLRRYGLSAMAGVAPDDDDGNGATHRPANEQQRSAAPPHPAPKAAPATAPAPDPKASDVEAALAKMIAAFPAREKEIRARIRDAVSDGKHHGEDALAIMRRLYRTYQDEAGKLPTRTPDEAATVQRLRDTIAQLDTDGLAEAAAQAREIVSEYGGLDGCTGADLPALVSQVDALATSVRAGRAA